MLSHFFLFKFEGMHRLHRTHKHTHTYEHLWILVYYVVRSVHVCRWSNVVVKIQHFEREKKTQISTCFRINVFNWSLFLRLNVLTFVNSWCLSMTNNIHQKQFGRPLDIHSSLIKQSSNRFIHQLIFVLLNPGKQLRRMRNTKNFLFAEYFFMSISAAEAFL